MEIKGKIFDTEKDGLPDRSLSGRVAFITDHGIFTGWYNEYGNWTSFVYDDHYLYCDVKKYIVFDRHPSEL